MKQKRVLILTHPDLIPPQKVLKKSERDNQPWKTEYDVWRGLTKLGHTVEILGVSEELGKIRKAVKTFKPHIAFNLLEEFHGEALFDQHVVSYLELLKLAYTGCNPRGLVLSRDKALCKKILTYHRIPTPKFMVIRKGCKVRRNKKLEFPMLVKSLNEDASLGISQASIVTTDKQLDERVAFIHNSIQTDALVEQYIEGREFYMGVLGNKKLETLPLWEMWFENLPEGHAPIATQKVKWDPKHQEKIGCMSGFAKNVDDKLRKQITHLCKRAYRVLGLSGYARLDLRATASGEIFLIEVNANPDLAYDEDFSYSARRLHTEYPELLEKILKLGLNYDSVGD